MADNYNILIAKLDEFIRKYYKNQLIRGGIYTLALVSAFFILVNLLEYYAHFGIAARTVLFYSFLLINLAVIVKFVAIPLSKLYKIGKLISHTQAAEIIGKHFPEVNDKLLNILQLKELSGNNPQNTLLIQASINQKIVLLKPIPFTTAIDLKKNRKHLKYAAIPALFILLILFTAPSLITDPTTRLLKHGTYYEKMPPFRFTVTNKKLEALQQEDFQLNVKLTGDEIPENVFISLNGIQYQLNRENTVLFHYTFKNLQKDVPFKLMADGYESTDYMLKVMPKPIILNFDVSLNYPAYINKKDEEVQNTGDLVVPAGTKITWRFNTKDTKILKFKLNNKSYPLTPVSFSRFMFSNMAFDNKNYTIVTSNEFLTNKDSLSYSINVIPDAYPVIKVEEFKDSVYESQHYFKGMIRDDYGFSALTFNFRHILAADSANDNSNKKFLSKTLQINGGITQQQFFHYFDLSQLDVSPGDEVEYYFEVWDNDGVNGSKSTRSQKMVFRVPTLKEIRENTEKSNKQLEKDMEQSIKDAKSLQKQIDELDKKLVEKKTLSWQEKKQLKDLLEKQKELQNKVENIQKQNFEKTVKENQFEKPSEELLKKQEELNKLMEQIMTPELKELLQKLQDMMDKMDKNKVNEMLEKMKLQSKDLEKEMDRNLEIFKQLEMEKKINDAIDKLKDLSKKQGELSKETENSKKDDNKDLQEKQDALNKEFEDVKKDLKDLQEKNKELEEPKNIENSEKEQQDIQQDMNSSSSNLSNKKNKKASQSQKSAAQKMEDLAQKMEQEQQQEESEQAEEDINTLRTILENLIEVSFDQEDLMTKLGVTKTTDPKYLKIGQGQMNIKDDLGMIEDSLFALSKRQPQISTIINREITDINQNVQKSIDALGSRQVGVAAAKQQYTMTSVNNLALLLAEALQQMQQQQNQKQQNNSSCKKPGKCKKPGSCSKPGNGKPSFNSMRKLQEQLNKQMEEMMKEGKNPNGKKQGQGQSMNEQLARMAAQQEAIRQQLQQMEEELKKEGQSGNKGDMDKLKKDMEQTESDLVNKLLSPETIKRQQDILTRLLESEKAEREREMDEKRESNEGKNLINSNPNNFLEYKRIKLKEIELLKTIPPSLKPFYKNKVNEYFYNFEN